MLFRSALVAGRVLARAKKKDVNAQAQDSIVLGEDDAALNSKLTCIIMSFA